MIKDPTTQEKLAKQLGNTSCIIVGVSGGPDSIFLLEQLLVFSAEHALPRIIVAHINHHLRPFAGAQDEKFVRNFCQKKGLTFEKADLPRVKKGNTEETARNFRYNFFTTLKKKYRASHILTAHHRDDSIETALFNLIRGSFLDGISGIEEYQFKKGIFRPMLHLDKNEILRSLKKNKIKYRIDRSNHNTSLSRNFLRKKLIPLIEKINPGFKNKFSQTMHQFKNLGSFLDSYCTQWLQKENSADGYSLAAFLHEPEAVQHQIIAKIYRQIHGNSVNFNQQHLAQIIQMLHRKKAGIRKEFGNKHFIEVKKDEKARQRFFYISSTTSIERKDLIN